MKALCAALVLAVLGVAGAYAVPGSGDVPEKRPYSQNTVVEGEAPEGYQMGPT